MKRTNVIDEKKEDEVNVPGFFGAFIQNMIEPITSFYQKKQWEKRYQELALYFEEGKGSIKKLGKDIVQVVKEEKEGDGEREEVIQTLFSYMHAIKNAEDPERKDQYKAFKHALQKTYTSTENKNWKHILLNVASLKIEQESYKVVKEKDSAYYTKKGKIAEVLSSQEDTPREESYGVIGSNFTTRTAISASTSEALSEGHNYIMDDFTCGRILNREGKAVIIGALADGAGGHCGDEAQDKAILRTAHFAAKHAVRLLAAYRDKPGKLDYTKEEHVWPEILKSVEEEVRRKNPKYQENCTLLCYAIFPIAEGYQLWGVNIGDGLVGVWKREEQEIETLSPARTAEGWGPALMPDYKAEDVMYFQRRGKEGDIVFAMSDGIHNGLSVKTVCSTKGEKHYKDIFLNIGEEEVEIVRQGRENDSAEKIGLWLKGLANEQIKRLCKEKEEKGEAYKEGDDIACTARRVCSFIEKYGKEKTYKDQAKRENVKTCQLEGKMEA